MMRQKSLFSIDVSKDLKHDLFQYLGKKYFDINTKSPVMMTGGKVLSKILPAVTHVDYSARILGLNEMLDVTTKPIIFDADNGGRIEHLPYLVRTLERIGVSAIVFEDKIGLKKNSLYKNQSGANQDSIKNFCNKLRKAKESKISDDLFIVARIESFILGKSLKNAIHRAESYSRAGADAILIHSKKITPQEIFEFADLWKGSSPLVVIPTTYYSVKINDLIYHKI